MVYRKSIVEIHFQRSYSLGQEYGSIRDRATKILEPYLEDPNVIKFRESDNKVLFTTERLIPTVSIKRLRVMLLFSNPHPHSIQQGMFLSPNRKKRENPFWPTMRDAGLFSVPESKHTPDQLRDIFLRVKYSGPFVLYFYCYYAFPTRYPNYIHKIFGKRFFSQVIEPESKNEFKKTVQETSVEAIVTFNKDIFNLVSEEKTERYIDQLNKGQLVRSIIRDIDGTIPIFLTYPTGWRYHPDYMILRKVSLEMIKNAILQWTNVSVD